MSAGDNMPEELPENQAMQELLGAVTHTTPPPAPARERAMPVRRMNNLAGVGLGFGIASFLAMAILFTPLAFFGGFFIAAGMVVLAFAGGICSVMGMQQARLCHSGRGVALAGLIVSLITIAVTLLLVLATRLIV